jgi:predicted HNH restriction endonuclease
MRDYNKNYRISNPDKTKAYDKQRYQHNKEAFAKQKVDAILSKGGACVMCGIKFDGTNAVIFDFHHKDPKEKKGDIAHMQNRKNIQAELDKCDLLCANCHRLIHSEV